MAYHLPPHGRQYLYPTKVGQLVLLRIHERPFTRCFFHSWFPINYIFVQTLRKTPLNRPAKPVRSAFRTRPLSLRLCDALRSAAGGRHTAPGHTGETFLSCSSSITWPVGIATTPSLGQRLSLSAAASSRDTLRDTSRQHAWPSALSDHRRPPVARLHRSFGGCRAVVFLLL